MRIAVSRAPGAERDVSPLELFFDLVYVFATGRDCRGRGGRRLVGHVTLTLIVLALIGIAVGDELAIRIAAASAVLVAVAIADTIRAGVGSQRSWG